MEGYQTGEWILMDLNDVLIHIFQSELREFYNIEGMWSEARRIEPDIEPEN
jgi:ribosome-associated protein